MRPAAKTPAVLKTAHQLLLAQTPYRLSLIALLLMAAVGAVDVATGYELSFSIFYVIPVAIASWYAGRPMGYLLCVTSALTWLAADLVAGHVYTHPAVLIWNAGVRLGFFAIIATLLHRLRRALDVQQSLAQQDGLTGILNARAFKQRCVYIFELATRHGRPLALGYLDLDGFKAINDRFGHSVGDEVLKAVAGALTQRLRATDIGGRLGGDEFAVLLPETDFAGAQTFFAGLHEVLNAVAERNGWPVGFSVGVALFEKATANADEAIRYADGLMYKVKRAGRNTILYEQFHPGARTV